MKHSIAAALLAGAVLSALPADARQTPSPTASPAPSPSPSPSPEPKTWQVSGFGDASYSTVGGASSFAFANGVSSRVFDTVAKQPMLNAIDLQLQKNGALGGKLELTAGQNADVIASYPDDNQDGFDVTQAYLSYTAGRLSAQAGKFVTLAGAEVIDAPGDVNLSRSILFGYAVPFTHTGVRLTYAPSSTVSIIGGVNNGWDNLKGNGSGGATAEYGLAYGGSVLAFAAQGYSGTERISNADYTPGTIGHRNLIDLVGTWHATSALTFTANYDSGRQGNDPLLSASGTATGAVGTATWNGIAGYASWQFTPKFAVAVRGETFGDHGGYRTGYDQRWHEGTLTFDLSPNATLLFRLEARADGSNVPVWTNADGSLRSSLASFGVESVVKF